MKDAVRSQRGFTLTELLVAAAVIAVVMGGMFTLLDSGQQTFLRGSNEVEAQQTLRLAISRMTQEIRDAGYCPSCGTGSPAITPFPAITNATATGFTIQNDWNGDWTGTAGIAAGTVGHVVVGADGTAAPAVQRGEQVIYAYDAASRTLTRREVGIDAAGVTLATGIATLTLTFQNAAGATVALPTTAATALTIRTVVVTVVGQPANQPTTFATGRSEVAMTDAIRLRNRAL